VYVCICVYVCMCLCMYICMYWKCEPVTEAVTVFSLSIHLVAHSTAQLPLVQSARVKNEKQQTIQTTKNKAEFICLAQ